MNRLLVFGALGLAALSRAFAQEPAAPNRHLVLSLYFSPTCPHCHPVRALIKQIKTKHPQVQPVEFNLAEPNNVERMAAAYQQYRVPEEEWGGTIAVFAGDRWWNDGDRILQELAPAVDDLIVHPERWTPPRPPATALTDITPVSSRPAEATVLRRVFSSFGIAAVAGTGLLDGINPCALATLVFLISYLTYSKRRPREVLAAGLLFGAGVFLAYLAIGLGLFRALQMTSGISVVSRLLYPVMAGGTFILAYYSARDYLLARRGAHREMTLQLPGRLKQLAHQVIRQVGRPSVFLGLAFAAGVAISVLELFCTGQIYLPTLMYMWSTGGSRTRVLGLLVLYVGMFTLPVIVLTLLAYGGVNSRRLVELAAANTARVKLATALLFLGLSGYLTALSLGRV